MRRRTSSSNRKPSVVSLAATLQRQAIPCCAGNGVGDAISLIPWDAPSLLAPKNLTPSTVSSAVLNAIHGQDGQLLGFAKVTRDLTERRAAEERVLQAQKMEAVGQLTGGIAHDFNNLLTVISGNIEALQRRLPQGAGDHLRRLTDAALRGTTRAALLTHRLLAFSRRQPLEPKVVSVNRLISSLSEMLRRTLGESILIETVLSGGL